MRQLLPLPNNLLINPPVSALYQSPSVVYPADRRILSKLFVTIISILSWHFLLYSNQQQYWPALFCNFICRIFQFYQHQRNTVYEQYDFGSLVNACPTGSGIISYYRVLINHKKFIIGRVVKIIYRDFMAPFNTVLQVRNFYFLYLQTVKTVIFCQ